MAIADISTHLETISMICQRVEPGAASRRVEINCIWSKIAQSFLMCSNSLVFKVEGRKGLGMFENSGAGMGILIDSSCKLVEWSSSIGSKSTSFLLLIIFLMKQLFYITFFLCIFISKLNHKDYLSVKQDKRLLGLKIQNRAKTWQGSKEFHFDRRARILCHKNLILSYWQVILYKIKLAIQ